MLSILCSTRSFPRPVGLRTCHLAPGCLNDSSHAVVVDVAERSTSQNSVATKRFDTVRVHTYNNLSTTSIARKIIKNLTAAIATKKGITVHPLRAHTPTALTPGSRRLSRMRTLWNRDALLQIPITVEQAPVRLDPSELGFPWLVKRLDWEEVFRTSAFPTNISGRKGRRQGLTEKVVGSIGVGGADKRIEECLQVGNRGVALRP